MQVQTAESSCADQILFSGKGDVLSVGVAVVLGQAEVNEVDDVAFLAIAEQQVLRLDVPM